MENYFEIDYDKKTIDLFYGNEKFTFDLNEGDVGDYWNSFTTKDSVVKDINFYQEDESIESPLISIYDIDSDGYIDTTYEYVVECKHKRGNPQNYFNPTNIMKYDYDFFLFTQLAYANERIESELAYDLAFGKAITLYENFLASASNDGYKSLYDCMEDYFMQLELV